MKRVIIKNTRGFTLLELLIVLSIVSVLAALLFPLFLTVRGRARQAVCASNLYQIGAGISMYVQDYDGAYPYAVDPVDRNSLLWSRVPQFAADIPRLPWLQDALQPYVTKNVFACPSDTGFEVDDFVSVSLNAFPSSYEKYGTSYLYRTELAAFRVHESAVQTPERVNVVCAPVGYWHGTLTPLVQRYNVLFADGHVKNVSRYRIEEAWNTPLSLPSS